MNKRCPDYDFLYATWIVTRISAPAEAPAKLADLQKHAAECEICTQAVKSAWAASKPLPEVTNV